jgi:hypothetical protein
MNSLRKLQIRRWELALYLNGGGLAAWGAFDSDSPRHLKYEKQYTRGKIETPNQMPNKNTAEIARTGENSRGKARAYVFVDRILFSLGRALKL